MSAPVEPYYAPLAEMACMQKLESHGRDSLSKAGLRKRHWRSWSTGERLLLAVSVCMALLLVSLSGFILNRTDNKLVITTDPKLLSHAKFLQGAWLTLQSFCVMALMLPVWNCVTTIKSEEWIRMAGRSPSVLVKHVNAASATPTSAFNSLAYGQSRHASPLFRCALLVSALAFAASSTSHGLLFLNVVKIGQPGNIDIAVLGDGAVYKYAELVGSARRADGPFNEESAIRLASLMYLSRSGANQGGSLATGLSASGKLYDVNNVSVPQFILPTPVNTPDGSSYGTDVITFNTSCGFFSPNEVSSASGKAGGWTTVRYAWNEPTTAVQIRLDDGTDMVVGATLSLPQTIAPVYFLASPDTLTDYSSRGYTGWLILANSHFNSIRLDGLPATGNLSSFGKEANNTMATVLLCQPNLKIEAARVQYGVRESVVRLSGGPLTGNIDVTQAGLLFSSTMAALHRAPSNSSFVGSDDIFSTSIVLDQVRRYTKDGGWFYPNPLPVIAQNLSPYWSTIGKAYLAGVTAQSVMAVPATVPVDCLALSTAKTNFYISLFLFLTLLGFLLVVSSRRVLPTLELIPVLEAFSDFGQAVSRKEASPVHNDQTMKQRRVVWREDEGRFEATS